MTLDGCDIPRLADVGVSGVRTFDLELIPYDFELIRSNSQNDPEDNSDA